MGFRIRGVEIVYDAEAKTLTSNEDAGDALEKVPTSGKGPAKLEPNDGRVQLRILVDTTSIEVFANDGRAAITDLIFPRCGLNELALYAKDGEVALIKGDVWTLASTWTEKTDHWSF